MALEVVRTYVCAANKTWNRKKTYALQEGTNQNAEGFNNVSRCAQLAKLSASYRPRTNLVQITGEFSAKNVADVLELMYPWKQKRALSPPWTSSEQNKSNTNSPLSTSSQHNKQTMFHRPQCLHDKIIKARNLTALYVFVQKEINTTTSNSPPWTSS